MTDLLVASYVGTGPTGPLVNLAEHLRFVENRQTQEGGRLGCRQFRKAGSLNDLQSTPVHEERCCTVPKCQHANQ
jgi:hypothetical protein